MRRIHLPELSVGSAQLPAALAHHIRVVLRMRAGETVRAFDAGGAWAEARLMEVSPKGVSIFIERIEPAPRRRHRLAVAAAIPKGPRADWMIEKLSELGIDEFFPLLAERAGAEPGGANKIRRWERLAIESAEQSGRNGVMAIRPAVEPVELIKSSSGMTAWFLSFHPGSVGMTQLAAAIPRSLLLLIGPEGDWSEREMAAMQSAGAMPARLTETILRVETAAIAAAAVASVAQFSLHGGGAETNLLESAP